MKAPFNKFFPLRNLIILILIPFFHTGLAQEGLVTPEAQLEKQAGAPQLPGIWTTIDYNGSFDARHETSFVKFQEKFYMIGGRESRKIECYDPQSNTWSQMKTESPLIHHYQPVVWNKLIYMVGAMTGNYPDEPPMTHIQIYDPIKDVWTKGGVIPVNRRRGGSGTVVYNNKIYVACGIELGHTSGTNSWFDVYDPKKDQWKKLPDAPHRRDHFHAVVVDDKLYCMGGRTSDYHEPDNFSAFFKTVVMDVDVYNFKSGKWSTLESKLPFGSAAAGVAVLDGKILYFGGETGTIAENLCWLFDPLTESWTQMASLNQGRHGSQAIVYKGKVWIASGSPVRGGGNTTTMEIFSY